MANSAGGPIIGDLTESTVVPTGSSTPQSMADIAAAALDGGGGGVESVAGQTGVVSTAELSTALAGTGLTVDQSTGKLDVTGGGGGGGVSSVVGETGAVTATQLSTALAGSGLTVDSTTGKLDVTGGGGGNDGFTSIAGITSVPTITATQLSTALAGTGLTVDGTTGKLDVTGGSGGVTSVVGQSGAVTATQLSSALAGTGLEVSSSGQLEVAEVGFTSIAGITSVPTITTPALSAALAGKGLAVDGTTGLLDVTGSGVNPHIVYLSQNGITSDATNGLEYGVAPPSGATGQEVAINALITASIAAAEAAGATGVKIVWDVAVALGAPIFLFSNMTIECPDFSCGAILRDLPANGGVPLIRINGAQADMGGGKTVAQGATAAQALATQQSFGSFNTSFTNVIPNSKTTSNPNFFRIFNPTVVNAQSIIINGGTWNGNQPGNFPRTPNTNSSITTLLNQDATAGSPGANVGIPSIMEFRGVNGLTLNGIRAFTGILFSLDFVNCGNVTLYNPDVDNVNDMNFDNDAIHFNGPCDRIRIYSPRVHCADDCIAFNADDANFDIANFGDLVSGQNWVCGGPITDVMVEDVVSWQGRQGVVTWGGLSLRSTVTLLDNVIIRGWQGTAENWSIWAPQFFTNTVSRGGSSGMLVPGSGNIGRVVLEDITLDMVSLANAPAIISWGLNTQSLTIRNRNRVNAQVAGPDIFVGVDVTIAQLNIQDYIASQEAGATINGDAVLQVSGNVNSLNMTGSIFRDPSLAVAAAPALLVTSFTPTAAQGAFPFEEPTSGVVGGIIGTAKVDMDANAITNLVQLGSPTGPVTAGEITTLRLAGQHYNAGGGSPLSNDGIVTNYIVGSGIFPLVYNSSAVPSFTGTSPVNVNAYSENVVSSATLETPAIGVSGENLVVQGSFTGSTPASGTAVVGTAASVAMTGFEAASGRWNALAPVSVATTTPTDTATVTLNTGATATTPNNFSVSPSGAAILQKASFIPGTTGFATTLGAYEGSSNGDVNNDWSVGVSSGTVIQPVIASGGGGLTHSGLTHGSFYHNLTNIETIPAAATGWKFQITDLVFTSVSADPIFAMEMYADSNQENTLQASVVFVNANEVTVTIANNFTSFGTGATIATGNVTLEAAFVTEGTWTFLNTGTSLEVFFNETLLMTGATSGINALLTSSPAISSITWASGVATVTTAAAHDIPVGDTVQGIIAGATPSGFNGQFVFTSTAATTFTFPLATNPGTETVPGTYSIQICAGWTVGPNAAGTVGYSFGTISLTAP
jgi:hypothetical protein